MLPHYLAKHERQEQAINNKLQGSVATHLMCVHSVGVVNNHIKKDLFLSLSVDFFKLVNIWQSCKQELVVSCNVCAWPTHCPYSMPLLATYNASDSVLRTECERPFKSVSLVTDNGEEAYITSGPCSACLVPLAYICVDL